MRSNESKCRQKYFNECAELQYRITKTLKLSIKVAGVNLAVNPEGPVLLPSSSKTTLQCTLAFVLSPCAGMAKGNYCSVRAWL